MPKKTRKPEPQTPALAPPLPPLSPAARTPRDRFLGRVPALKPQKTLPRLYRMQRTLAREIYRLAREQKDTATLLRLAEALYPQTFGPARPSAPGRKLAAPDSPGA